MEWQDWMSDFYMMNKDGTFRLCETVEEWNTSHRIENRRVAETYVGKIHVSTVFLGHDHRFGSGPPVLFETMIFGGPMGEYQERYCTHAEAIEGHTKAVKLALESN